jgi:hypothetical protein
MAILMADDRYSRVTRPGEAVRREAPPAGQEVDPLMELARLIGQADPFADMTRERAHERPAPPAPRIADPSTWQEEPAAPQPAAPQPSLRHSLATPLRPDPPPRPEPPLFRTEPPAARQEARQTPRQTSRPEPPLFRPAEPVHEPAAYAPPATEQPDPRGYEADDAYGRSSRDHRDYDERSYDERTYDDRRYDEPRYDEPRYGAPGAYDEHAGHVAEEAGMRVEPEALDTWRPNDPYQLTEGMFPREPQVFADPAFTPAPTPAPAPEPPASGLYETRRAAAPPPAAVFDPDDPLGFEHNPAGARTAQPQPSSYGVLPDPRAEAGHPAGVAADRVRTIVDRDRGLAEPPAYGAYPDDARALHPDAYLRQPAAAVPPTAADGYGDAGAAYDAPAYPPDVADSPYSTEELAAHYAQSAGQAAPRRSRAVVFAAVAFALVFVGAAGAFSYRLLFSGAPKPAPVIRADASPAKVVPASSGDSGKQIQDRLADKASAEKVVSREEQPVEIRDASRPPTPRMVFPNQTAGAAPSAVQPPAPPAPFAAAAAPVTGGEAPKKIRTVTIRSDQPGDTSARSARAAAPAHPDANAPMPLNPTAAAPAPRVAAAPPPSHAAAPGGGGYVVQVSAQKTEAEAQAAFRNLQGRYPDQLGGRSLIVRRKDTASGTMYGTQVGPFASRDEAVQMCEGLKAAGGSCFVQRN